MSKVQSPTPGEAITTTYPAEMSYDLAGRKLAMSDPDLGAWSYTYDAAGNLRTQTGARNCRTTLSYEMSATAPLSRFWRCTRAMRRRWCRRPSSRLCRQS